MSHVAESHALETIGIRGGGRPVGGGGRDRGTPNGGSGDGDRRRARETCPGRPLGLRDGRCGAPFLHGSGPPDAAPVDVEYPRHHNDDRKAEQEEKRDEAAGPVGKQQCIGDGPRNLDQAYGQRPVRGGRDPDFPSSRLADELRDSPDGFSCSSRGSTPGPGPDLGPGRSNQLIDRPASIDTTAH